MNKQIKKKYNFKKICLDLENVDFLDKTFLFEYPIVDKKLENFVKKFGILDKIIVEKITPKNYRIISGFKTAFIAKKFNIKTLDAVCFEKKNVSDFEKLKLILEENLVYKNTDFNEVEKSNFIHKFFDFEKNFFKLTDFELKELCKILKFSISDFNIHKKNQIYKISKILKDKIVDKKISLETAINLTVFDKKNKNIILKLLENLQINFNSSKEIVENLKEIYKNYGSKKDKFNQDIISKIIELKNENAENSNNLKIEKIKNFLDQIKNPNFYRQKQKFETLRKKLESSCKNIKLNHFSYFEKENLYLTIDFKDLENFSDLKIALKNLLKKI